MTIIIRKPNGDIYNFGTNIEQQSEQQLEQSEQSEQSQQIVWIYQGDKTNSFNVIIPNYLPREKQIEIQEFGKIYLKRYSSDIDNIVLWSPIKFESSKDGIQISKTAFDKAYDRHNTDI